MQVKITNIEDTQIKGVTVHLRSNDEPYLENYFDWRASPLVAEFNSSSVSGGILKAWHHTPIFTEVETHVEDEMFYFTNGTALMLFVDVADGKPVMESAQMVRIKAGTQIIIAAGKAHFVPVAEDDEPMIATLVSPKVDAPRMTLAEPVEGVC